MVLIIQNDPNDAPAYLGLWLSQQGVPHTVFHSTHAHTLPVNMAGYQALAVLGGPMSVLDALEGCERTASLIRQTLNHNIPVLGHCLGGQLLSYAAGGVVRKAHTPEIGWHTLDIVDTPMAHAWLGQTGHATVYEWHTDTFTLPPSASHLASSTYCTEQAFCLGEHGQHLGMQFHIEVDAPKINTWLQLDGKEIDRAHTAGFTDNVHSIQKQLADNALYLAKSQAIAAHMYSRWLGFAG